MSNKPISESNKCYKSIINCNSEYILKSINLIQEILIQYKCNGIALSFNGGKDCTVILHLLFAVLYKLAFENKLKSIIANNSIEFDNIDIHQMVKYALKEIKIVYFHNPHEFEKINEFLDQLQVNYAFDIMRLEGSYKSALDALISDYPIRMFIMGQRKLDPDAVKISEIQPSDPGWPKFLRLNPILNWTHAQVWEFLIQYDLPYCELYDHGYTSLGSTKDTIKNPHLLLNNGNYLPAFKLVDENFERAGRIEKKNSL